MLSKQANKRLPRTGGSDALVAVAGLQRCFSLRCYCTCCCYFDEGGVNIPVWIHCFCYSFPNQPELQPAIIGQVPQERNFFPTLDISLKARVFPSPPQEGISSLCFITELGMLVSDSSSQRADCYAPSEITQIGVESELILYVWTVMMVGSKYLI